MPRRPKNHVISTTSPPQQLQPSGAGESSSSLSSPPKPALAAFAKITTTTTKRRRTPSCTKRFLPTLILVIIALYCVLFRPNTKTLLLERSTIRGKNETQQQITTTDASTSTTIIIPKGVIYDLSPDFDTSFPLPKEFDEAQNQKLCDYRKAGMMMPTETPKLPEKRSLPRPEFKNKIKYTTLGGSNYIGQLQLFIDSLVLRFGIARHDILILSLDITTTNYLLQQGVMVAPFYQDRIVGTNCYKATNVTNIRCQVSLGKSHIIEQVLADGNAIFLFDADVFFYKHPYLSLRVENPNLDLYVQRDMLALTREPNPMGPSNFGVLLAFPGSMLTRHLMHYINNNIVNKVDQYSFNDWLGGMRGGERKSTGQQGVCAGAQGTLDYEQINHDLFFNAMLTEHSHHTQYHQSDIILFHSTCAEGSHTKEFIAKCMFPSNDPNYYFNNNNKKNRRRRKTVTNEHMLDASNVGEIDYTLRTLAKIAKATGRAVRVNMIANQTSIYDPQAPWSIINGEAFRDEGIDLVEPNYWANAQALIGVTTTSGDFYQKSKPIMFFGHDSSTSTAAIQQRFGGSNIQDVDELVIRFDPNKLQAIRKINLQHLDLLASDYICKMVLKSPTHAPRTCLHLCNGGHF